MKALWIPRRELVSVIGQQDGFLVERYNGDRQVVGRHDLLLHEEIALVDELASIISSGKAGKVTRYREIMMELLGSQAPFVAVLEDKLREKRGVQLVLF